MNMYTEENNYERNVLCAQFSVSKECLLQHNWALWMPYITTIRISSLAFSYNESKNGNYKLQSEILSHQNGSAGQSVCKQAHLSEFNPQSPWNSDLHMQARKLQLVRGLMYACYTHIRNNK